MTSLFWKILKEQTFRFSLLFASLYIIYLTEFATALRHLVIYLSIKVERRPLRMKSATVSSINLSLLFGKQDVFEARIRTHEQ